MATAFGLNVNRFIAFAVLAGSVVVAAAVASAASCLRGLASPYRALAGRPLHRPLLPASALVGAIRRHLGRRHRPRRLPPRRDPAGVVTAVRGRSVFILTACPQAAHMTGIAADNLVVRRNGATLLDALSLRWDRPARLP